MNSFTKIFVYFLIGVFILALGGLAGWYFFLSSKTSATVATDTARGLGAPTPTFEGTTGSAQANTAAGTITINGDSAAQSGVSSTQLWEVAKTPVAGFRFITDSSSSTQPQKLYYADRATGYIESADLSTRSTIRLTNDLHPKLYQVLFTNSGGVLERTINDKGVLTTYVGIIKATVATDTSTTALSGVFFPDSIFDVAVNPATQSVFYLTHADSSKNVGAVGTTAQWDATKQKQVFSSLIGSWRPQYLSDGRIILTESATDDVSGYAYQLNSDGSLTDLVRNIPGLTIVPDPSSKALIYGQSSGGSLALFAQQSPTATTTALSLATVADKCVWLPGKTETAYCGVPKDISTQTFLADWYRGTVHTNDDWWQVNAITGETSQIYSPQSSDGVALDVSNPQMDSTGTYIAFTNTTDDSLWVLRVTK